LTAPAINLARQSLDTEVTKQQTKWPMKQPTKLPMKQLPT
jgi:hypothetical protein